MSPRRSCCGWWSGADLAERHAIGLLDEAEAERENAARDADRHALAEMLDAPADGDAATLLDRAHAALAASGSALVMIQADDLAGEMSAINIPGTVDERPNWRRRISLPLGELFAACRQQLARIAEIRSG